MHALTPFDHQVKRALLGERIIYHVGNLACDREWKPATEFTARAAWVAMEDGRVDLIQRRVVEGFEYIAIKRRDVEKVIWTGCYDPERKNYTRNAKETEHA
jgi:hypothetical protein